MTEYAVPAAMDASTSHRATSHRATSHRADRAIRHRDTRYGADRADRATRHRDTRYRAAVERPAAQGHRPPGHGAASAGGRR